MVTSVSEMVRASVEKSLGASASRALMSFSLISSFPRISVRCSVLETVVARYR